MLSVSTKTGDAGKSSLADGTRLPKDHPVFEVIGTIDELNSYLGLVVAQLQALQQPVLMEQKVFLESIQHELFVVGGEVAGASVELSPKFLKTLERTSENLQKEMQEDWHHQFVLPGGHAIAAQLDIARAVCRRLERRIATLSKKRTISVVIKKTVNRLSDYLYVLRCFVNQTMAHKEAFFQRAA